jgi:hypothetical protein
MIPNPNDALALDQLYHSTDEATRDRGRAWYPIAQREAELLALDHSVELTTAAGAIAALSPRMEWSKNLDAAATILRAASSGAREAPRVGLGLSTRRAWSIALGAEPLSILGGRKVRAFYRALIGDLDSITLDIWSARAARGADAKQPTTDRDHNALDASYRVAALAAGEHPREYQAIVWIAARGIVEHPAYYSTARSQLSMLNNDEGSEQ